MKKLWKILVPVLALAVIFTCVLAFASSAADTTVTIPDGTVEEGSGTNVVAIIRGGAEVGRYGSVKDAVSAAQSGDTIKFLNDFIVLNGFMFPANKPLTVDFDGHTLYADSRVNFYSNTFMGRGAVDITFTSLNGRGKVVYATGATAHFLTLDDNNAEKKATVTNIDFTMRTSGNVFNAIRGGTLTVSDVTIDKVGGGVTVSLDYSGTDGSNSILDFDNVDITSTTGNIFNVNQKYGSVTGTFDNVNINATTGRILNLHNPESTCTTSFTFTDCGLVTGGDCGFAIKGGKLAITGTKTRVNMTAAKNFIWDTTKNSDLTLGYGIRFAENSFKTGDSAQLTAAQSQIVKDGLLSDTYPYVYGATLQVDEHGSTAPVYWDGNLQKTINASTSNNVADGDNTYCYFDSSNTKVTGPYFVWQRKTIDFATYRYAVIEADLTFKTSSPIAADDGTAGYIYAMWGKSDGSDTGDAWKYSIRFKQSADGTGTTYTYGEKSVTLPFRQWAHINWIIDTAENKAAVYINGELLASVDTAFGETTTRIREFRLGGNKIVQDYDMCFDNLRMVGYADADFANNVFAAEPVFTGSDFLNYSRNADLPGAQIVDGGYYRTLALAVEAAKPNDIITLLENSDEGVMVDKPLSIDDAGHVLANVTTHRLISYENVGPLHTFTVTGVKMNLTLYSDFVANLYIPAPDGYEGETVTIGGKAYYVVKTDFAANKVGESKTVEVEGMNISVSILSYARALFGLSTGYMENEKTLMADALVYANAAAKLINGSEYANITALLNANASYKSTLKPFTGKTKDMTSVSDGFEYATLDLTAQPSFIFAIKSGAKVSVSYTNFWGVKVTKTEADAVDGKIVIDDMRIFDFANEFTLTVGEKRTTYSLADYAANTDVKDLCDALHTYIETAKEFKKTNPSPKM